MAFPTSPNDRDTHTENGINYRYSDENKIWYRKRKDLHAALEQALLDIENLKSRVTTLEG